MNNKSTIKDHGSIFYLFLFLFVGFGLFLRIKALNASFNPWNYLYDVLPHLESSPLEVLLSDHHRKINIYRNLISNFLYQYFGISEITHRVFSITVSLLTFLVIFRFTRNTSNSMKLPSSGCCLASPTAVCSG